MTTTQRPPSILEGDWPEQGAWTYEDYYRLPDTGWRYEIIEGDLHMSPAPNPKHQAASNALSTSLTNYVGQHQLGKIYYAPIDIFLDENTNVQPDILFLSNAQLSLISDRGIEGPPELLIEILSPSNWIIDRQEKYELYERVGVKEYWIVDVRQKTMEVFELEEGRYTLSGKYQSGGTATSSLLEGFSIEVDEVCEG